MSPGEEPTFSLTPTQLKYFENLADGLGYQDIADTHGVTVGAVKNQLVRAYNRIGIARRPHRIAYAMYLFGFHEGCQARAMMKEGSQ